MQIMCFVPGLLQNAYIFTWDVLYALRTISKSNFPGRCKLSHREVWHHSDHKADKEASFEKRLLQSKTSLPCHKSVGGQSIDVHRQSDWLPLYISLGIPCSHYVHIPFHIDALMDRNYTLYMVSLGIFIECFCSHMFPFMSGSAMKLISNFLWKYESTGTYCRPHDLLS